MNALVFTRLLAKAGHSARVVRDGEETSLRCAGKRYDVVLMDVQMPGMDGVEGDAAHPGTQRMANRRAPAGHRGDRQRLEREDRETCLSAGMDDYLSKPIDAAALFAAISRALGGRGAARAAGAA